MDELENEFDDEFKTILSDCPDCGDIPDIKEYYREIAGVMFSGVVCENCNLAALHFSTQSGIHLWNEMVQEWSGNE